MRTRLAGRKIREYGLLIWIVTSLAGISLVYGDSSLTAMSNGPTAIEIQLDNDEPIAGIQFVLRSSSHVVLQEIHRSGRTSDGNWTVASNLVNDSTLNVVIVSSDASYFTCGKGTVAEVSILMSDVGSGSDSITFTRVVAADPGAKLVPVETNDLVFNSGRTSSDISASDFSFSQNYPNPFNPSTKISYELKKDAQINLTIFDITGREIEKLVDRYQSKGIYTVTWNSSESRWGQLASGTYFARLEVEGNVVTRKMSLTK